MSDRIPVSAAVAKPWVVAKSAWRQWELQRQDSQGEPDLRIGITSSFTDMGLVQFVGAHLVGEGFRPDISVGPYNQLFQVCLAPASHFDGARNALVLLWRTEDLMADEIGALVSAQGEALARAREKLSALIVAIGKLRESFGGTLIVGVPPYPTGLTVGPLALDNATGVGAFHRMMTSHFVEAMAQIPGVHLFDLDALQRSIGLTASFNPAFWYLYRQPFTDPFLYEAGTLLGRIIVASRRSPKKCLVLDCDNTLWGGIVGEDGIDGIQLGDEFPGSAYRDFQRLILHWRQQGVLLAIASKNNEADVWEVFDRHQGMVLKRSDISAWQINWLPKAQSIPLIAKALNIGIELAGFHRRQSDGSRLHAPSSAGG